MTPDKELIERVGRALYGGEYPWENLAGTFRAELLLQAEQMLLAYYNPGSIKIPGSVPILKEDPMSQFEIGQNVHKPAGYPYPGVVVSAFTTRDGAIRYVVESDLAPGMLHIFSGAQLRATS